MWFFRKKAKQKSKGVVRAPVPAREEDALFSRAEQVRTLRDEGDPRWRRAAWTDLREAAEDDEGLERLAKAISVMLRRE